MCFLPESLRGLYSSVALFSLVAGSGHVTWQTRVWWRSGQDTPPLLSGLVTLLRLSEVPRPHEPGPGPALHSDQEPHSDTSQS